MKSTIHITFPRFAVAGSARASQIFPSSNSASPITEIKRDFGLGPKCESTYCLATAANKGATAPKPTEPVEKSTVSGSFVLEG